MADDGARARIEALAGRLSHDDPAQLVFQVGEIAGERTYLRHGVEVCQGAVVLDVGANVGVAAVFFATQCGAALVHSFEPVEPVFRMLQANVDGLPACVAHNQGMASAPGHMPITYYPGAAAMSGLHADPERDRALVRTALLNAGFSEGEAEERLAGRYDAQTLTCELRTLSSFLRDEELDRVDLLKVDVERAELDVLAGIADPDWARIGQVVVEVHDDAGRLVRIQELLEGHGFRVASRQDAGMRGTGVHMVYAMRP